MPRVFVCLAIATSLVLLMTAALGIVRGSMPVDVHVLLAVFALLVSCLVQVVVLMYVSVTGKAVAQAVHLGKFDLAPLEAIRRTKRSVVHTVALVVFSIVFVVATGAIHWQSGEWRLLHDVAAGLVIVLHGVAFVRQFELIIDHKATVTTIMNAYAERSEVSPGQG